MFESTKASGTPVMVAIDVGMTYTGVAYIIKSPAIEMVEPWTIQNWPGNGAGKADKVPTAISYLEHGKIAWGFQTQYELLPEEWKPGQTQPQRCEVHDWFKIFLDEKEYDKAAAVDRDAVPPSHAHVKTYYRDFMRQLYLHIRGCLQNSIPGLSWEQESINFIFSVPTTWSAGTADDLKQLAKAAGFEGSRHTVEIGLTEAEAAAVCTFSTQAGWYSHGDVILCVDAGGGTTDIALMRSEMSEGARPTLIQLDQVRGDEIGSVEIDLAFFELAKARLRRAASSLQIDTRLISEMSRKMTKGQFKIIKEEFGNEDSMQLHQCAIEIQGLSSRDAVEVEGIRNGRLILKTSEIRAMFDEQLSKMYQLIDMQLSKMAHIAPHDQVKWLVLSGGLGSSPYVRKMLEERYAGKHCHVHAPLIRIISSTHPQLAVVKGLLIDRMQKAKYGKSLLRYRVCRQSLGVICEQKYDPSRHRGQPLRKDPIDGMIYAQDQISWFIEQGQTIDGDEPVEHEFFRVVAKDAPIQPFETQIAICNSNSGRLPANLKEGGAEKCCVVTSDLTAVDRKRFKKIKRRWWQFSKKPSYYKAEYKIKFLLNAVSIEIELWFDNERYNEKNAIPVKWEDGIRKAPRKEHRIESTTVQSEVCVSWRRRGRWYIIQPLT